MVTALATVVTTAACQAGNAPPETSVAPPATTSTPTAAPPTSTASTSTPTPSAPPTSAPARKRVDVGTVTDTRSASATGSGSADLRFTTKGQFAVVVRLDCSRCLGAFTLGKPDRMTPYGQGKAPIKASYLTAVFTDDDPKQSMQLTANGRWKVTFLSWNDLPVEKGRQSGRGSTVIYLGDRASRLGSPTNPRVRATPSAVGCSPSRTSR